MPQILTLPETGSTNDDVHERARLGAPEGLWVRAERQTGGRGRQGRAWQSPPGNLYASTLIRLRPGDPPAATLALVAAVALQEVIAGLVPERDFRIKWPNDMLMRSPAKAGVQRSGRAGLRPSPEHGEEWAKLAGILLEREGEAVVIGFGVNLAHAPEGLDRPATGLDGAAEPGPFLEMLAEGFARWLARWRSDGLAPIRARWLTAAHPRGTALTTSEGEGLFDGLDEDGALRLRLADGTVRAIHAGDVFLI